MVKPDPRATFVAHVSVLSALVVMACFLPLVVAGMANLVLHPQAPVWARGVGAVVMSPILFYFLVAFRLCLMRGPVIEVDGSGLMWRRWSTARIPWTAVKRWKVRSSLNHRYVTLWLHDRSAYPASTVNRWLAFGNRGLGYGDITLATGGTDGRFEDLVAAIQANMGEPDRASRVFPPDDPRMEG